MGRHRSKLENSAPPEREPTDDELDALAQATDDDETELDPYENLGGAERARLEIENERTEREGEEIIDPLPPTESERALELRRRYGWG